MSLSDLQVLINYIVLQRNYNYGRSGYSTAYRTPEALEKERKLHVIEKAISDEMQRRWDILEKSLT